MEQLDKVKGIGNKGLLLLQKLGINNIDDLISYYPFRYAIFSKTDLNQVGNDDRVVVEGIVESIPTIIRFKGKMNKMTFRFNTNEIITNVAIFNRAFLKNKLKIGNSIVVVGKFNKEKNIITASDIKFETLGNSTKIEPIYHITNGLSNKIMNNYINHAIDIYSNQIYDIIPSYLKERYQLLDRENAIQIAHNPNNIDELKKAQITLKYEELFLFMLKINYLRLKNKNEIEGLSRDIDMSKVEGFIANLPFLLTFDQKKVIDEILHDLKEKTRMNRLLQGDVGSGKTIVAIIAMYANYLSGYQSALMAPTEILARQHYDNIKELFKGMDINVELLTGSTDRRQKKRIYSAIQNGETNIIIGTHALIQRS
jgi:ATP-dependent DNA helicase RecG